MAKSSWRFEFIDVNKSIDISEETTPWIGYAVVRAPKGEIEAKYIPPANQARIEAMFGYASADYPDLYELIDFNRNYGVYVSAPSAVNKKHPNYYGGVYLTSKGIQQFYKVTDKKKPNFEVGVTPTKETSYNGLNTTDVKSTISAVLDSPYDEKDQSYIDIFNVPAKIYNKSSYIDFDFWGTGETFRYQLDKVNGYIKDEQNGVVCGTIYPSEDNEEFNHNPKPNCFDLRLGGSRANVLGQKDIDLNTPSDKAPFIKLSTMKDINGKPINYKALTTKDGWDEWVSAENEEAESVRLRNVIIYGGDFKADAVNYDIDMKPLCECFKFIYDIKDDVYAHISQVSPTAWPTHITVDSVVYDKYIYDVKLPYTTREDIHTIRYGTKEFKDLGGSSVLWFPNNEDSVGTEAGVYTFNMDQTENEETGETEIIGWERDESYETKKILALEPISKEDNVDRKHSIFFIEDNYVVEMTEDSIDVEYQLKENPLFNSFHSTSYECDMEDERHNAYDFVGSLDEFGVDENGSDNYWEELLPPGEAVTYAEVYVDKTFDKDLDKKGVYIGTTRIEATSENPVDTEVSGQRYIDYLVQQNIDNGYTGGDVSNETSVVTKAYAKCIKLGLEEAAAPKYEDAIIFMEYSGIDSIKTYFNAIRTNHKMATIVSPKNITEAVFNNISKIRVINPLRGSAQYCQELQYKDKNLRKKYYSCPIGAMASMLMRIIERNYGGTAPMWINDKGMGGQIEEFMSRTPIRAKWDFTDDDTKILDQKQINPIVIDTEDGTYATSHRTTELYSGDWGYLGHSMAFDLCKREIRNTVMKDQIGKKINDYWIDKRQEQVDKILGYRTSGSDQIWSYAKADIRSVNNEYTKAQRIFNLAVEVRVNPFSEKVRLTFTNLGQITVTNE